MDAKSKKAVAQSLLRAAEVLGHRKVSAEMDLRSEIFQLRRDANALQDKLADFSEALQKQGVAREDVPARVKKAVEKMSDLEDIIRSLSHSFE
jgi:hypothetical protein